MRLVTTRAARTVGAVSLALVLAVCCGCSGMSSGSPANGTSSASKGRSEPQFSLKDINNSFSAMAALKPLAAKGKGKIVVILPNPERAGDFVTHSAADLKQSFQRAGLDRSQYKVYELPGTDQLRRARAAISEGASVLIVDGRYYGAGVSIESYARSQGVPVIDYDWLTLGGARTYYVSYDSLKVGVLLGIGLVRCVSAWHVKHPRVIVMRGAPTDYNVALYTQGYEAVLASRFSSGWKDVSNPRGTWDPLVAVSEFKQRYAHKKINAALIPNDENAEPIISYLRHHGIKPKTFPTTGLDATPGGLRNIRAGYQCGTVYKPIWLEAQAAAALAMYKRAEVPPPTSLLNGNFTDPQTNKSVASALLTPQWVTTVNLNSTVIADSRLHSSSSAPSR